MKEWIWRQWAARRWQERLKELHPDLYSYSGEPDTLRLVSGPGRSGTSWVSQVLGSSGATMSFFSEPLHPLKPWLRFSRKHDRTAIPYQTSLPDSHPLAKTYTMLTFPGYDWTALLPATSIKRCELGSSAVLVKEVHALLATEALVRRLRCRTLFVTRTPIFVVDSLLSFRGLGAPIWQNEAQYVTRTPFLRRFFGADSAKILAQYASMGEGHVSARLCEILSKVLTVALLNKMLEILAAELPQAKQVTYEELCAAPQATFAAASEFLGLGATPEMTEFLARTQSSTHGAGDPYSVFRDTARQPQRAFRFLSVPEVDRATAMLDACGLQ